MAEIFRVTNGNTTSNLNTTTGATGWQIDDNGYEPATAPPGLAGIILEDEMQLSLRGTTMNSLASQYTKLNNQLREASDFMARRNGIIKPTYLESQGRDESNPRFYTITGGQLGGFPPFHDHVVEGKKKMIGGTLNIQREASGRSGAPGTAPTASTLTQTDGPITPTLVHVANYDDTFALTHIYAYDDNLAAFSANLIAETAFPYFEVSGSTPADEDLHYFGSTTGPFHQVVLNLGTLGVSTTTATLLEYWDGDSWENVSPQSMYPRGLGVTSFGNLFMGELGQHVISVGNVSDWATVDNGTGVTAYWIRLRLNVVGGVAVSPAQATVVVYSQTKNKAIIPAAAITGDVPALALLRMENGDGTNLTSTSGYDRPSRVIMGARTVENTNFRSRINLGNAGNNSVWAVTATDATFTTDPDAAGNKHALVDMATTPTVMTTRVTVNQDTGMDLYDYRGKFRVFLIAQQLAGAAGDCSVQLDYITLGSVQTDTSSEVVALGLSSAGREVVDMGVIRFPFTDIVTGDADLNDHDIRILVKAKRASGVSTLELHEIVMIPADEWLGVFDDPVDVTGGTSSLDLSRLQADSGVLMPRVVLDNKTATGYAPSIAWSALSKLPTLQPATAVHLHFLFLNYPAAFGTGPFVASLGTGLTFEALLHSRYSGPRGAS